MHGDRPGGPIRWRMHLTVPPERVYAALDSADGRASFWAQSAIETAAGIEFVFANGDRLTCRVHYRRPPCLRNHDPSRSWDHGYADQ